MANEVTTDWARTCDWCKGYPTTGAGCSCPPTHPVTAPERPSNKPHPGSYEALRGTAAGAGLPVDPVNHPVHYGGKVECIDALESALGPDGFRSYCRGNAMKYCWRADRKGNPVQDIQKAIWYLKRLESTYE